MPIDLFPNTTIPRLFAETYRLLTFSVATCRSARESFTGRMPRSSAASRERTKENVEREHRVGGRRTKLSRLPWARATTQIAKPCECRITSKYLELIESN